ncbi:hypothetical protein C0J52_09077 [Blattella germanica]|nr:hypothetical protein C0J52_09077 [Blattella germanica]
MALVLSALALMTEGRFFFNGFNGYLPPLLIEEQPFAVDPTFSAVPLVLMPQEKLTVVPVRPNATVTVQPTRPTTRPTKPQLVTVLDFPTTVQTPPVLVYQPPTGLDDELVNRNPPQGVVPAGIVQSAAPTPNLSVFVNSKESTVLQELRDQAANRYRALRT